MKAPNLIFKALLGATIACFIMAGCKKKDDPAPTPNPTNNTPAETTQQTLRSSDHSNVDNESNQAMDEANTAMSEVSTMREVQSICGADIDKSDTLIGIIRLNYDGVTVCSGKKRAGQIVIQLPYNGTNVTPWSTMGAVAKLTFNNYKITYVSTGKTLTLNGTHSVTNVNGGGWIQLYFLNQPIVHKVRADMEITFEDSTTREWHSAIKRTLDYTGGVLKSSVVSDTSTTDYPSLAFWGKDRYDQTFSIDMPYPFSYKIIDPANCLFKPTGQLFFHWSTKVLKIIYGVNSDGTTATTCPYGYKFEWTDDLGTDHNIVVAYQ